MLPCEGDHVATAGPLHPLSSQHFAGKSTVVPIRLADNCVRPFSGNIPQVAATPCRLDARAASPLKYRFARLSRLRRQPRRDTGGSASERHIRAGGHGQDHGRLHHGGDAGRVGPASRSATFDRSGVHDDVCPRRGSHPSSGIPGGPLRVRTERAISDHRRARAGYPH